jgi:hypothetical protein
VQAGKTSAGSEVLEMKCSAVRLVQEVKCGKVLYGWPQAPCGFNRSALSAGPKSGGRKIVKWMRGDRASWWAIASLAYIGMHFRIHTHLHSSMSVIYMYSHRNTFTRPATVLVHRKGAKMEPKSTKTGQIGANIDQTSSPGRVRDGSGAPVGSRSVQGGALERSWVTLGLSWFSFGTNLGAKTEPKSIKYQSKTRSTFWTPRKSMFGWFCDHFWCQNGAKLAPESEPKWC